MADVAGKLEVVTVSNSRARCGGAAGDIARRMGRRFRVPELRCLGGWVHEECCGPRAEEEAAPEVDLDALAPWEADAARKALAERAKQHKMCLSPGVPYAKPGGQDFANSYRYLPRHLISDAAAARLLRGGKLTRKKWRHRAIKVPVHRLGCARCGVRISILSKYITPPPAQLHARAVDMIWSSLVHHRAAIRDAGRIIELDGGITVNCDTGRVSVNSGMPNVQSELLGVDGRVVPLVPRLRARFEKIDSAMTLVPVAKGKPRAQLRSRVRGPRPTVTLSMRPLRQYPCGTFWVYTHTAKRRGSRAAGAVALRMARRQQRMGMFFTERVLPRGSRWVRGHDADVGDHYYTDRVTGECAWEVEKTLPYQPLATEEVQRSVATECTDLCRSVSAEARLRLSVKPPTLVLTGPAPEMDVLANRVAHTLRGAAAAAHRRRRVRSRLEKALRAQEKAAAEVSGLRAQLATAMAARDNARVSELKRLLDAA